MREGNIPSTFDKGVIVLMAIFHFSVKNIGRSQGRSAVACSAYRSGTKIKDIETGIVHDYTRKNGIVFSEIILCENAPPKYKDRAILWNAVQEVENQSNARLAREFEVAIPNELNLEQSKKLIHDFAQSFADEGMCVDVNIHWKNGNHHAHIMATTRQIKKNGEWGQKEKKGYKLDEQGQKIPIIDKDTGKQKIGAKGRKMWQRKTVETNDWNKTEKVEEWRERWANECNKYLEQQCHIDHRSYYRQGIERLPTRHEGYIARKIEQRGTVSELCEQNRVIGEYNNLIINIQSEIQAIDGEIQELMKQKGSAINERIRELLKRRTATQSSGRVANGERAIKTGDTESLVRQAKIGIDIATAREKDSRASRIDRESERERLATERSKQEANRKRAETERLRKNQKKHKRNNFSL